MHKFHFRPGKSAFMALVLGLAAIMAFWFWWTADNSMLPLAVALLMAAAAGKLLSDAFSETPALSFDGQVLRIRKPWSGVAEVPWRSVQHIGVEVMTLRYWGLIPIAKHEFLVVRCDGGLLFGSRKLRLALKMVMLPPGGTSELMALLYRMHVAGVGNPARSEDGQPFAPASAGSGDQEPGFDADAALARYLARKEAGAAPGPSPTMSAAPARPVFGRKSHAG
jgi:hypothetical protein